MSGNSAPSAPAVSPPKGVGALSRMGETFAPDLHTGTGNSTVPLALPPARNGFQPKLHMVYGTGAGTGTGAGSGPFGLGWWASILDVPRRTSPRVSVCRINKVALNQAPRLPHAPCRITSCAA